MGRDVVIIGGGHNGLVAACYLARSGLKPLVLEQRAVVGGAAVTDEIHPGFRCPTLSHAAQLHSAIIRDLNLGGLEFIHPDPCVFAPLEDGRALILRRSAAQSTSRIAQFSQRDAARYPEFVATFERIATFLDRLMTRPPPSIDSPSLADVWSLLKSGRSFKALARADRSRLLRWLPMSAADLVGEWFGSEPLRAVLAARGVFGALLGPRSPGSGAQMLLQSALGSSVDRLTFLKGGPGSLTTALADTARRAGAEIRANASVSQIAVKDGQVTGVVLKDGEAIDCRIVVSNLDPRRTLLQLLEPAHLDPTFVARMKNYRCAGTVAKINLALSGLPRFTGVLDTQAHVTLSGRIHIAPDTDYLEHAFDDAKYGEFSSRLWLDAAIPSLADPSLAPPGAHVMSVYVQYAPYELAQGSWRDRGEELANAAVRELARYAPNLPALIVQGQVLTPLDLEQVYGLTGGQIYHGEPAMDQLFTMRPLYGWAHYRTPIRRLYLCGAGTHPGCGVNGLSGANASREILKDIK